MKPATPIVCFIIGLVFLTLVGCAKTAYPVSTGSHAAIDPALKDKKYKVVIWSDHPAVGSAIAAMFQQGGHTIVERARILEVFNEQKMRLTNTPDDNADVLKVGRLLGADRIVFAESTVRAEAYSSTYVNRYGGGARSGTIYHLSVSVRAVAVDTGEVRWSGSSYYPGPVTNPDQGLVHLTQAAMARAVCPIESGYEWKEQSGCVKKE